MKYYKSVYCKNDELYLNLGLKNLKRVADEKNRVDNKKL